MIYMISIPWIFKIIFFINFNYNFQNYFISNRQSNWTKSNIAAEIGNIEIIYLLLNDFRIFERSIQKNWPLIQIIANKITPLIIFLLRFNTSAFSFGTFTLPLSWNEFLARIFWKNQQISSLEKKLNKNGYPGKKLIFCKKNKKH